MFLSEGELVQGRYRVEGVLGAGGFATVYSAVDTRLNTQVAVKVLRAMGTTPAAHAKLLERFKGEAQAAAQLGHPSVVRVYEHDVLSTTQQPFLVMERVDGHTLAAELEACWSMPPERVVRLWRGPLEALSEAHERGIVHRDLKPDNLMIARPGHRGERMVILDFGIARRLNDDERNHSTTQGMMGTMAYLPPELFKGARYATPASDVFQVALIMAEMLTGSRVVSEDSLEETARAYMAWSPVERAPQGPLHALLSRALSHDPSDRPVSAGTFLDALEEVRWVAAPASEPEPAPAPKPRVVTLFEATPSAPEPEPRSKPEAISGEPPSKPEPEPKPTPPQPKTTLETAHRPLAQDEPVRWGLVAAVCAALITLGGLALWAAGDDDEGAKKEALEASAALALDEAEEAEAEAAPQNPSGPCPTASMLDCLKRATEAFEDGERERALAWVYGGTHVYQTIRDGYYKAANASPSWGTRERFKCPPEPEPCELLDFWDADRGTSRKAEAMEGLKRACFDGGSGSACHRYGLVLHNRDDAKDAAEAAYREAHKLGSPGGTGSYGMFMRHERGIGEDDAEALEKGRAILKEACDGGNAHACEDLGEDWFRRGDAVEGSWEEAKKLLTKACDGKHIQGCYWLGGFHKTREEFKEAKPLLAQACKHESWGCDQLGRIFLNNDDWSSAKPLFERACLRGLDTSCLGYAYGLEYKEDDWPAARSWLKERCDRGLKQACYLYAHGVRHHDKAWPKARGMLKDLCEGNDGPACREYAFGVALVDEDWESAKDWFQAACMYGQKDLCGDLDYKIQVTKHEQYKTHRALLDLALSHPSTSEAELSFWVSALSFMEDDKKSELKKIYSDGFDNMRKAAYDP